MQLINALAALSAALPLVQAAGSAMVQNNCKVPVYLWPTDIQRKSATPLTLAPGESYSEAYRVLSSGGVSLKLSKSSAAGQQGTITQFEYTLAGGFIWYDGSHVDCRGANCPFYADGIYMDASDPTCPTRTCKPNQDCTGFYINWNDDINTLSCKPEANVNFYLCSQGPGATGTSGSGSGSSTGSGSGTQASASAVAASVIAAQPSAASAAPATASVKVSMEAPAPWTGRIGGSSSNNSRFVKKIKARGEMDARDLHSHMRRHNHKRSH